MLLFTPSRSTFIPGISIIVEMGSEAQMIWAHASSIIARMHYKQARVHYSMRKHVSNSVRTERGVTLRQTSAEHAVTASIDASKPHPTPIRIPINLAPK